MKTVLLCKRCFVWQNVLKISDKILAKSVALFLECNYILSRFAGLSLTVVVVLFGVEVGKLWS